MVENGVIRLKFMVRALTRSDYDALYRLIQNTKSADLFHPQTMTYTDFAKRFDQYLESQDDQWMIYVVLLDQNLIGKMELKIDMGNRLGQFDIVIDEAYWGKGLAQKALNVLFDYAFKTLGLNKLIAEVLAFNVRSINFIRKMGMQLEGILREERLVNDEYVDIYRFGLLRKEFQEG
ncbi:MAG TPA: GNAT family protein [Haloplasmataceae bacterium]